MRRTGGGSIDIVSAAADVVEYPRRWATHRMGLTRCAAAGRAAEVGSRTAHDVSLMVLLGVLTAHCGQDESSSRCLVGEWMKRNTTAMDLCSENECNENG